MALQPDLQPEQGPALITIYTWEHRNGQAVLIQTGYPSPVVQEQGLASFMERSSVFMASRLLVLPPQSK